MLTRLANGFSKLLCRLKQHEWQIETRGYQFEGLVYPVRFRTCLRCHKIQKEAFDETSNSARWIDLDTPTQAALE